MPRNLKKPTLTENAIPPTISSPADRYLTVQMAGDGAMLRVIDLRTGRFVRDRFPTPGLAQAWIKEQA